MKNHILLVTSGMILFSSFMAIGQHHRVTNWMNETYIICLKKKLPCDCEKETGTYFVMHLDTTHSTLLVLKYGELIRDEEYEIKKQGDRSYLVRDVNNDDKIWIGKISFRGRKLLFKLERQKDMIFNYYGASDFSNDIQYEKQNTILLNKEFVKRGYDSLQTLLHESLLNCRCNSGVDGAVKINVIWNDEMTKTWILEMEGETLHLSSLFTQGDSIRTERIANLKWKAR